MAMMTGVIATVPTSFGESIRITFPETIVLPICITAGCPSCTSAICCPGGTSTSAVRSEINTPSPYAQQEAAALRLSHANRRSIHFGGIRSSYRTISAQQHQQPCCRKHSLSHTHLLTITHAIKE